MAQLPFNISLDQALSGAGAPPRAAYDAALLEAKRALGELRQAKPELLTIVEREDDLAQAAEAAEAFGRHATDIFILGTGG